MIFNLIKSAKQLLFNKTGTNLESDNVQGAIEELDTELSALDSQVGKLNLGTGKLELDYRSDNLNLIFYNANNEKIILSFYYNSASASGTKIVATKNGARVWGLV